MSISPLNHLKRPVSDIDEGTNAESSNSKRRLNYGLAGSQQSQPSSSVRINYPFKAHAKAPAFQYPFQLISFSYSASRVLEFTDAALRYYVPPPPGADLSFRYDNWIKRPEERGRLDGLLEACRHQKVIPESQRTNVISWRGVMTKILTSPYEERDGWDLNIMFVAGTFYFEEHTTEKKLKEKENLTPRNHMQTHYGYAFESYCTSTTSRPSEDPDRLHNGWSGDVNTNVQWCSVAKTKLGNERLIVGGEVDCIRDKYTGQPDTFVELKTSMTIRNAQDEARFEKKLLKFYFQSFLLGVPEIIVGFRTPQGRLAELQSFKTVELPRLVRGKPGAWDPNLCLSWGDDFIAFLKSEIAGWLPPPQTSTPESDREKGFPQRRDECVWRATFTPKQGVEVYLLSEDDVEEVRQGEERIGFLPRTYWEAVALDTVESL